MYIRNYAPSRRTIAAACRRIQARWTAEDFLLRAGLPPDWVAPRIALDRETSALAERWERETSAGRPLSST